MEGGQFKVDRLLGEGGFGKVFLIEHKADPSVKHAMKLMEIGKMDKQELVLALQEIKLLSELDHEHVLSYINCFQQDGCLCIVTEFCPNGDLSDYIKERHGTPLEEPRLIEWFRQIASAVKYLHGKNIIHRDLKVQNIFLDANMDCKLGDFGIARILDSVTDMAQTQIGTPHYMSPEIFMGIQYNSKTDIWSLAVVMYELATLEKPFDSFFMPGLIFKITRGEKPDMPTRYRPEFADLLSKMMEKDPNDRPSAEQILRDEMFTKSKKPSPMPNLKSPHDYGSEDYDKGPFNLNNFLKTISDMSVAGKKPGAKLVPKPIVLPKKVAEEVDRTEDSGQKVTADPVMELVTRTLKDMGHNTIRPAGVGILEQQIRLLKLYILNVLDQDQALFNKASKELDATDSEEELEEKLIRVLGHEKFGLCGVEMLHYKNFSYNLKHRKK